MTDIKFVIPGLDTESGSFMRLPGTGLDAFALTMVSWYVSSYEKACRQS